MDGPAAYEQFFYLENTAVSASTMTCCCTAVKATGSLRIGSILRALRKP
jgi:hypothetical protein